MANVATLYFTPAYAPPPQQNFDGVNYTVKIYAHKVSVAKRVSTTEVLYSNEPNTYPQVDVAGYQYIFFDSFRTLPQRVIESKPVVGTVAAPINNAVVNLGFMPSAIVCQQFNTGIIFYTGVYTNLQLNVDQDALNYNNVAWYLRMTPTATGFKITAYGQSSGVLRYIAFR